MKETIIVINGDKREQFTANNGSGEPYKQLGRIIEAVSGCGTTEDIIEKFKMVWEWTYDGETNWDSIGMPQNYLYTIIRLSDVTTGKPYIQIICSEMNSGSGLYWKKIFEYNIHPKSE